MHILIKSSVCCLILSLCFFSCKSKGPLTPEESFSLLKEACRKTDAAGLDNLLSERSREKIKVITKSFSDMDDSQLKAIGRNLNADPAGLKNLSVKDYLSIQFLISKNMDVDIFKEIISRKIIGIDVTEGKALVRLENGIEIYFLKEGPYWKFDMEELSSKN